MTPRNLIRAALLSLLVLAVLVLAVFNFSSRSTAQVGLPLTSLPAAPTDPATPLWRDVDPALLAHLALKREI